MANHNFSHKKKTFQVSIQCQSKWRHFFSLRKKHSISDSNFNFQATNNEINRIQENPLHIGQINVEILIQFAEESIGICFVI